MPVTCRAGWAGCVSAPKPTAPPAVPDVGDVGIPAGGCDATPARNIPVVPYSDGDGDGDGIACET